jgi:precorrin-6A/cobalt-precorrin-6A reductase
MRVLILGGTAEARELKARLGDEAILSLAGRANAPADRVGGFGGAAGLAAYVQAHAVDLVVDATHPFAARMSANAVDAGVPLLRLERAGFSGGTRVRSLNEAARLGTRVFLTVGVETAAFDDDRFFLVRALRAPDHLPRNHELIVARGPFAYEDELRLMRAHAIDTLITTDSGGDDAKLRAAAALHVETVVVERPWLPPAPTVATVEEVLRRLGRLRRRATPTPAP